MNWPRAQKWSLAVGSHDCRVNSTPRWTFCQPPVNRLSPTSTNLPFQNSTAISGSKFDLSGYTNYILHLGNILQYYNFGGHLCRQLNYIWLVIIFRLPYACLYLHNIDQTSLNSRSPSVLRVWFRTTFLILYQDYTSLSKTITALNRKFPAAGIL